ncbi:MAG: peptide deformylase [Bacteroidetes bacterium]|nr:peptide deformylase [Bacteroidota bacterium]MBM3423972.1 peptide deformylase [Bacteroidota bacterium]
MIIPIIAYGDPLLKKPSLDVDRNHGDLDILIQNMFETMYHAKGVGLAAPQIGLNLRLFVVDGAPFAHEEGEEPDPRAEGIKTFKKVFINPNIIEESGEPWTFQEGCLSIPKIRENVSRKETVLLSYYNESWEFQRESFSGFAARIIQHEYDHIEGVLFTDRLNPLKRKLIQKRLKLIAEGQITMDYKLKFYAQKK